MLFKQSFNCLLVTKLAMYPFSYYLLFFLFVLKLWFHGTHRVKSNTSAHNAHSAHSEGMSIQTQVHSCPLNLAPAQRAGFIDQLKLKYMEEYYFAAEAVHHCLAMYEQNSCIYREKSFAKGAEGGGFAFRADLCTYAMFIVARTYHMPKFMNAFMRLILDLVRNGMLHSH